MTDFAIQEQIKTIKWASDKAARSKKSALKFLIDAGIIEEKEKSKPSNQKKK